VNGREVLGFWAGLRPATVDGWPVMGPVDGWDGLFVCAGHFRNGILLSPFSGRFMADGIVDGSWDARGRPFFPARFQKTPEGAPWK
jgi:glycine oxidase